MSYYLVPLAIAAVTLPWVYSLILSGIALAAYSLLLVQFYPLETFPMAREKMQVYGMWLSIALAAAVITFFAAKMAEELRRQEQLRAERREEGCVTSNCWPWLPRRRAPPMNWARLWRP